MEIVKYTVSDEDPDDEDGPLVLTFDVYNHEKMYVQMLLELYEVQDVVGKVSKLFLQLMLV